MPIMLVLVPTCMCLHENSFDTSNHMATTWQPHGNHMVGMQNKVKDVIKWLPTLFIIGTAILEISVLNLLQVRRLLDVLVAENPIFPLLSQDLLENSLCGQYTGAA